MAWEDLRLDEFFLSGQIVIEECHVHHTIKPFEALQKKWLACDLKRRKVTLLHDNAKPHIAHAIKQTLYDLEWEVWLSLIPVDTTSPIYIFEMKQMSKNESTTLSRQNMRRSFATASVCLKDDKKW